MSTHATDVEGAHDVGDLGGLADLTAAEASAFLTSVTEVASGSSPDTALPLLTLALSQVLVAGARLGAIQDVVPTERFEPDPGVDDDADPLRDGPRQRPRRHRRLHLRHRPGDLGGARRRLHLGRPRRRRPRPARTGSSTTRPGGGSRPCGGGSSATCRSGATAPSRRCARCTRSSATCGSTPTRRPSARRSSTPCTREPPQDLRRGAPAAGHLSMVTVAWAPWRRA